MLSKAKLKKFTALKTKKFRSEYSQFIVEGLRSCEEALYSDFEIETLLYGSGHLTEKKIDDLIFLAREKKIPTFEIDETAVNQLNETVNSQGIFCIVNKKNLLVEEIFTKNFNFLVVVDSGQDPGNLGTIIRTCDWFGVNALVLGTNTVELYNPKVIRSTMGSIFHIPVYEEINLEYFVTKLKKQNYQIYAADINSDLNYHQIKYDFPLTLILGNENSGISSQLLKLSDFPIKIPASGKAESLNLASAGAVIISRIAAQLNG